MKYFYWLNMDHVYSQTFIFFSICISTSLFLHLLFQLNTLQSIALEKLYVPILKYVMLYYLKLHMNWQSVLTLSSSHVILTLKGPNYQPGTLDTLHTMLIGHTTFPSFLHPTSWQWHWSPHNVDINNSSIHGSWFRKEVISYQFIMSKSLIIMPDFSMYCTNLSCFIMSNWSYHSFSIYITFFISLRSCFVKLSSHLRDCNGQDDWHPMSNYELCIIMNYIIYKPIWLCPTSMLLHMLISFCLITLT